jgi:hypothetical protein
LNEEGHLRNCPACNSSLLGAHCHAIISPYVRRLGATKKRITRYQVCCTCGTGFFALRFSDYGMRRLYENYRGEHYTKLRQKWEGWYNFDYNDAHTNSVWLADRARVIVEFLTHRIPLSQTHIVDIGGDTGEIASRLGAASYSVLDYSNRAKDKQAAGTEREAASDLAVLAHVLEHVSRPINELKSLLNNFDSVYVEVPHGVPIVSKFRKSRLVLLWVFIQSFYPAGWRSLSAPSTGRTRPAKILRASEHLTFFTLEGLQSMANSLGVAVALKQSTVLAPDSGTVEVIQALFTRTSKQ